MTEVPTTEDLIALMEVCIDHRETSWLYEYNLVLLHNMIHRYYSINEPEKTWFESHAIAGGTK